MSAGWRVWGVHEACMKATWGVIRQDEALSACVCRRALGLHP